MKNGQLARDYRWNWSGKLAVCRHCGKTFWADPRTRKACLQPECQAKEKAAQYANQRKAEKSWSRLKRFERGRSKA